MKPVALLLAVAWSSSAAAAPLALRTGTTGAGWKFWELTPDLAQVDLLIAQGATGEMLDKLTPQDALASVNGGYFLKNYRPTGWVKDKVAEYGKPNRRSTKGGVFAVAGDKRYIGPLQGLTFKPEFVIQNSPILVDAGAKVAIKSSDGREAPRTVVCLGGARVRFILLAAQTAKGPTLKDTADLLAKPEKDGGFGCDSALNLDGGPSTGAWFAAELKEPSPLPPVPIGYGVIFKAKKP